MSFPDQNYEDWNQSKSFQPISSGALPLPSGKLYSIQTTLTHTLIYLTPWKREQITRAITVHPLSPQLFYVCFICLLLFYNTGWMYYFFLLLSSDGG